MNKIKIDLNLLSKQQDAITESNLNIDIKEGLSEMISTILDMAEDYNQAKVIDFVMILEE